MNRIDEVVDRYLTEGNEKSDLEKVVKTLRSANDKEQLNVGINMARNYLKYYGEESFFKFKGVWGPSFYAGKNQNELLSIIHDQESRIDHIKKVKELIGK